MGNKLEISLMVCGVLCAGAFTTAKIMGSSASHHSGSNQVLGVVMCVCSLLCGSVNLALAGVLGEMKLSVYDTVAYMSLPAFIFLIPFCLIPKPVPGAWPKIFGFSRASDFDILRTVAQISPKTFWLFALSGIFSFAYNVIQFSIVHTLSPSATAFGGNFNKAALIFLTLVLPFLQVHKLPGMPYILVIWLAVIGNVAAFSAYAYIQILDRQQKAAEEAKAEKGFAKQLTGEGEDEQSSSDEESSEDGGFC